MPYFIALYIDIYILYTHDNPSNTFYIPIYIHYLYRMLYRIHIYLYTHSDLVYIDIWFNTGSTHCKHLQWLNSNLLTIINPTEGPQMWQPLSRTTGAPAGFLCFHFARLVAWYPTRCAAAHKRRSGHQNSECLS